MDEAGELKLALEEAFEGISRLDAAGRYVYVNGAYAALLGRTPEELIGESWEPTVHPDDRPLARAAYDRMLCTGKGRFTARAVRSDGSFFPKDVVMVRARDDSGHFCFMHKAEQRLRAEQALRGDVAHALMEQKDLHAFLHGCTEAIVLHLGAAFARIWLVDERGNSLQLWASAGMYTRLDGAYSRVPIGALKIGRIARDGEPHLTNAVPDDPAIRDREWAKREHMIGFAGYPLKVEGRVIGVVAMFARTPLRHDTLEALSGVADLIAQGIERKRVQRALEEANRQKDEFLAMLAHELRNPLAPMLTAVQLIKRSGAVLQSDTKMAVEVLDRQVQNVRRIVDDLLEVARFTSGKIQLVKEITDGATLVAQAVETSLPVIEASKHELTVLAPQEPVRLEADVTRMVQGLTNLLNNAAKYTHEGGRIRVAVEQEGPDAVFRVRDTGMGIAPEMLDRIFDVFTQVDRSLGRSQGGLGIGLALVRAIVGLHGGTVHAYSEGLGSGSEFVIRVPALPRRAATAERPVREEPATILPVAARRVLVVDDNRDSADTLAAFLRPLGHDVKKAYGGLEALRVAATFQPDFVLLDIGLPDIDGYEVARRLRAGPRGADVALIAVTGYAQEHDRCRAREVGFDDHLVKPFDPSDLNALLSRSRSRSGGSSAASRGSTG